MSTSSGCSVARRRQAKLLGPILVVVVLGVPLAVGIFSVIVALGR